MSLAAALAWSLRLLLQGVVGGEEERMSMPTWRQRLRCLWSGHVMISDLPLSLNGKWAILASLWMPPATCRCCGKKYEGVNVQYAAGNGYLSDEDNDRTRCRIKPF